MSQGPLRAGDQRRVRVWRQVCECGPTFACRVCGGRYQWDMQATVLRVAKSMRERGFRVWVDTEMMSGSTLDAMAAAVEGAHCVLICITERYKVRARSILLNVS